MRKTVGLASIAIGTICGCGLLDLVFPPPAPPGPVDTGVAELAKFASPEAFRAYLAQQVSYTTQGGRGGLFDALPALPPAAPGLEPAPVATEDALGDTSGGSGSDGSDFSSTNLQEAGVDEADFVKNDGQYIYILRSGGVRVVQANPPEAMAQVASATIDGYGQDLYLSGDRLIALTQTESYYFIEDGVAGGGPIAIAQQSDGAVPEPGIDEPPQVLVTIFDVSDPAAITQVTQVTLDGTLVTSRLIDGKLHVVLTLYPILPVPLTSEAVLASDVDSLLPDYTQTTDQGAPRSGNLVDATDVYHPIDPDGYGLTTIVSLDVAQADPQIHSTAVMADAATIYASTQSLYLTDAEYNFSGGLRETTDLYKFVFTDQAAAFVAAGTVKGRLLNPYSLSEFEDHLRVATTSTETAGGGGDEPFIDIVPPSESRNNVYVLAQQGEDLNVVGQIEGLAPGERIFAARFVGPRGFLVTFVQLDPLFTLDLADPTNPRVIGELKIDGVSDYIHILDENHLLTVGRGAVAQGDFALFQGVQLSIFDVTDFANPQLAQRVDIGDRGTFTEVQHNPKAATFYDSHDLVALPIDLYESIGSSTDFGTYSFSGLYVYRVTPENGIEFQGRISTRGSQFDSFFGTGTRGVFIDETVYAATGSGVRAGPLDDIDSAPWSVSLSP